MQDFYHRMEHATLSRDPEGLCALLDSEFTAVSTISSPAGRRVVNMNKSEACEGYATLYESFGSIGERMGGILTLDYSYELHSIDIAPDKKSAAVEVDYMLEAGGSIMTIRLRAKETLVRKNGRVLLARSEGIQNTSTGISR